MATNIFFSPKVKSEQDLVEDLIIESLKFYGQDMYYLPRDVVNKNPIFADDVPSRFNSSYKIEMYIENVNGFDGEGDLMTKFGVELRDQATFIVSRKRWKQTVSKYDNEITGDRPREGDLLYIPLSKTMFEIEHVEHELPFYQINNLPTYKLKCTKFEYNDEQLDTGVEDIDSIEQLGYNSILTLVDSGDTNFIIGSMLTQRLPSGFTVTGEIVDYNDSDKIVSLAHIGSDDDRYHEFVSGVQVVSIGSTGNLITRNVLSVGEQLNNPSAQNEQFDDETFITFDENNPFGTPEVI